MPKPKLVTVRQPGTGRSLYNDPHVGWRWGARRLATPMDREQALEMVARLGGVVCVGGVPEGTTKPKRPPLPKEKAPGEWDKLGAIRRYMAAEDWPKALKLAKGYSGLGVDKMAIERAWEAHARPGFCRSLGRDPNALKQAGMDALRRLFGGG